MLPACELGPSFPAPGPRTALCSPEAPDNCLPDGWVGGEADRWMNELRRKAEHTGTECADRHTYLSEALVTRLSDGENSLWF